MHPLTQLRQRQGFSLISLARETGVSLNILRDIETGKCKELSPRTLERLAQALAFDPNELRSVHRKWLQQQQKAIDHTQDGCGC